MKNPKLTAKWLKQAAKIMEKELKPCEFYLMMAPRGKIIIVPVNTDIEPFYKGKTIK